MYSTQERHKPTSLKQTNKLHKHGKHRSKGSLEALSKGKVNNIKLLCKKIKKNNNRQDRRNQANQIRQNKRNEILFKKRNIGTASTAPFLISIVPLSSDVNTDILITSLKGADSESDINYSKEGYLHITVPRFKQRFSFITPTPGDLFANLDALKISDTVIFVMSANGDGIDRFGQELLSAIIAQGLPSTITILTELDCIPVKKRNECKQTMEKLIDKWIPEEKVVNVEKISDGLLIFRKIGSQKQRSIFFRDKRAHLIAEEVEFENDVLKVTGFIRGQPLSVNSLFHIPGWGNFQLSEIHSAQDSFGIISCETPNENTLLEKADPNLQETLQSENIPDPLDAEQTWPTENELKLAEKKVKVKKIPKGMSEYQAAWLCDEKEEENDDDDDDVDDNDNDDMDICEEPFQEEEEEFSHDEEEYDTVTETDVFFSDRYDEKMDYNEEKDLLEKLKNADTDAKWPDQVDTPLNIPARERFQRYRGLSSFRTSPWDPKENLPRDYARIFQFENFNNTRRAILKNEDKDGVSTSRYVTLHIINVPKHLFDSRPKGQPLVIFEMLPNEQKMSLVNIVLKRPFMDKFQLPIKSKEQIIFHCGYRRFKAGPIFSQHTNANKHKFERYFQPESVVVASIYAPIIFPPCHVLAFQECENGRHKLIATGSVLSVNPDRIVTKRVVLSGHPYKVHKHSAVIRFMFFNREDIHWFKPIELRTRYGRRGHIKESLGTKGHMKCVFDKQPNSQDTVFLNLYKRVFPKWNYEPYVTRPLNMYNELMAD